MALEGRVAIVTGSSRGIGRGIALAMAQAGAHVVVNYVSSRELAEDTARDAQAMGVQALVMGADVSRRMSVERMFSHVLEAFGRVDILVNNAAAFQPEVPIVELSEEDWDRVIAVNLKGSFLCAQAAARQMIQQRSGVIINISSLGSQVLMHNMVAYCASKEMR